MLFLLPKMLMFQGKTCIAEAEVAKDVINTHSVGCSCGVWSQILPNSLNICILRERYNIYILRETHAERGNGISNTYLEATERYGTRHPFFFF